ncbi:MAG: ATP-binding cassette protein [Sphingobacteriaceae bacterium]|jgi:lipopolysaccharide transport system ATP-binding protein|nr:ATP-binding cassette protein [Sphingobacteriaceae bacterium]
MAVAIKAENLSKAYQLGEIGTGTISRDLERWWAKMRGKEDPFLRIGEANDRTSKGTSDVVWSLRDINFEIAEGDAVGIIGRNGAGKSTLLKVLSRVTSPTAGRISGKGRIASLLEVGTGFHPELTGRENIYLNGAILGMRKREITRHFDAIVDFAGVERYVDTPVKRYSSGMYVRLAFAVAAHLESEILIVDEVLAVGDAEFQKKCLGKMGEVSKGEGRTVLFVSHNMTAVRELCKNSIVLKNGKIAFDGLALDGISFYQNTVEALSQFIYKGDPLQAPGNDKIKVLAFTIKPSIGDTISISSGVSFSFTFLNLIAQQNLAITFELRTLDETVVFHHGTWLCQNSDSVVGSYTVSSTIAPNTLNSGFYKFNFIIASSYHDVLYSENDFVQFEVLNESLAGNSQKLPGVIRPNLEYQIDYPTQS